MKKSIGTSAFSLSIILLLIFCFLCCSGLNIVVSAENIFPSVYTYGDINIPDTKIKVQTINDEKYLILPGSVSPECVTIYSDFSNVYTTEIIGDKKSAEFIDKTTVNLDEFCTEKNYKVKVVYKDIEKIFTEEISFLFSKNIPALYLNSENPDTKGRLWVESSKDKSNKATGNMVMQKSDGEIVYAGQLTQIKGRGNSTWTAAKKPYQIKTKEKVDLLQTGLKENKSKTWVLLANYLDPSLLRNSLALGLGKALNMNTNIESTYIDLYYDGEYRGNYMLTEKVEVGSGRVNICDLEEKNEQANPGVDMSSLSTNTDTTENGAIYTYCVGLNSPEDISGGYLLEMDYKERAMEEICYFATTRGQYVVVKSPEYASKSEMEYIATLYQEYEDAVYNGGTHPTTGKNCFDYVDMRSVACYYLVNEFSKARDCFSSSAYLHKTEGEDKLYMGPLWDYDLSFGTSNYEKDDDESPYGLSPYNTLFSRKLLQIDSFNSLVKEIYAEEFYPLITEIASGEGSLKDSVNFLSSSATINSKLWYGSDYFTETDKLRAFLLKRADALKEAFLTLSEQDIYFDVFETDWYYNDISKITNLGFMKGGDNGFFSPNSHLTRSEVAQVMYNMANPSKTDFSNNLSDVFSDDWFFPAVIWAENTGLIGAYPDGKFCPDELVSRQDAVLFLYRYAQKPFADKSKTLNFRDVSDISEDAKDAVLWAVQNGILKGDTNNKLYPKKYLTRAELAAILVRYSEK